MGLGSKFDLAIREGAGNVKETIGSPTGDNATRLAAKTGELHGKAR